MNADQRQDSGRIQLGATIHSNEIRSITPDSNEFMEQADRPALIEFKYSLDIRCRRAIDDDGCRSGGFGITW
jgi:hypothetical protein